MIAAVILLSLASIWIGEMLSKENIVSHYIEGTVIWGHPDSALSLSGQVPNCAAAGGNTLFEITCFAVARPLFFIQLAGMKLFYFFLLARPYYSTPHNLIILLYLLPVYTLAIISVYRHRKEFIKWGFAAIIILLQGLMVAFTFADWDSRHLEVVLPLILLLASGGAIWLMDTLNKNSVDTFSSS